MKNSIGTNVILTLFGESHGEAVGAILDGMPAGLKISREDISAGLSQRRPSGSTDTSRRESDDFKVLSGIFEGHTTGTPICIVIPNEDVRSEEYVHGIARPSHADYTAFVKYHGYEDWRGGGHFSGRVTAGIVAAGAIALKALEGKGISIETHILRCGKATDKEAMLSEISSAHAEGDSVGGVVQTTVNGLPAGVGEPWFDSLEGLLAKAVFSIGGVKGIQFGDGFGLASMRGSEANDAFQIVDGKVRTATNHNGGINGGISNGMPIVFDTAIKPTPSIAIEQQTVNFLENTPATISVHGRHDSTLVRRICPVITAMTAVVLCDALLTAFGPDYFSHSKAEQ